MEAAMEPSNRKELNNSAIFATAVCILGLPPESTRDDIIEALLLDLKASMEQLAEVCTHIIDKPSYKRKSGRERASVTNDHAELGKREARRIYVGLLHKKDETGEVTWCTQEIERGLQREATAASAPAGSMVSAMHDLQKQVQNAPLRFCIHAEQNAHRQLS
jgi:hypothetical protein